MDPDVQKSCGGGSSNDTSSSKVVLYSYWLSSCSWRIRFALCLKGIPYEYKAVDLLKGEQFSPEFERLNPLHYVPVLVDDDVVVSDSYAIFLVSLMWQFTEKLGNSIQFHLRDPFLGDLGYISDHVDPKDGLQWENYQYLEEKYTQKPLLPVDPQVRALNLQVASVINSSIQPLHMMNALKDMEKIFGAESKQWAQFIINKGFLALEKLLKDFAGTYATGEHIYMADVFLAPQIMQAAKRFDIDMSKYPTLSRLSETYSALPEFQASSPQRQPDACSPNP